MIIAFPQIVTGSLDKEVKVNLDDIGAQMRDSLKSDEGATPTDPYGGPEEAAPGAEPKTEPGAAPGAAPAVPEPSAESTESDPMKAMQDALKAQNPKP
jgi:hypothetical protein